MFFFIEDFPKETVLYIKIDFKHILDQLHHLVPPAEHCEVTEGEQQTWEALRYVEVNLDGISCATQNARNKSLVQMQ